MSSVPDGAKTGYELDVPGIESRWGEIFRTCSDKPWGPPSLLYNGYRVFPGAKYGRGVRLTPYPLLVPWSRKGRVIPLLPLWAVRTVQSLSACTRVTFTFNLTFIHQLHSNGVCLLFLMGQKLYSSIRARTVSGDATERRSQWQLITLCSVSLLRTDDLSSNSTRTPFTNIPSAMYRTSEDHQTD